MNDDVLSASHAMTLQRVQTERLDLAFLPGVGGRLISLRIDGVELLWVNPAILDGDLRVVKPRDLWPAIDGTFASWTNVGGSKSWPAPQGWDGPGEWAGPPDHVLDAGKWSFASRYDADRASTEITMMSAADIRTGLQVTRRFSIPDEGTQFRQRIEFRNRSEEAITWSMWEVCQVDTTTGQGADPADARIEVDLTDRAQPIDLGSYVGTVAGHVTDERVVIPIAEAVGKLGFPTASGKVRYRRPDGIVLELATEVDTDGEYPDGGSRAEVWVQAPTDVPIVELSGLHPNAWLAELELLSPVRRIGPGEQVGMDIEWTVGEG